MPVPKNVAHVLQGEMALVVSSMRRNARWAPTQQVSACAIHPLRNVKDEQDPLLQSFGQLKLRLASIGGASNFSSPPFPRMLTV